MQSESLRDDWSAVASALTPDGRVMFVDDGPDQLVARAVGPGASTIQRQARDGRRFRAVKVALEPKSLLRSLRAG